MRYFKHTKENLQYLRLRLIGWLVVTNIPATAQVQDSAKKLSIVFGEIKLAYSGKLGNLSYRSGHGIISYIANDEYLENHLLIIWGNAVVNVDLYTKETRLLAGSIYEAGYQEGKKNSSRFNGISGLIVSPISYPKYILVTDIGNFCIRAIDRAAEVTFEAIGQCRMPGNVDGKATEVRFGIITAIVKHPKNPYIAYVYDQTLHVLKSIAIDVCEHRESLVEKKLTLTGHDALKLSKMLGISFDLFGNNLFLSYNSSIWVYSMEELKLTLLLGNFTTMSDEHFGISNFSSIDISYPTAVEFLGSEIFVYGCLAEKSVLVASLTQEEVLKICEVSTVKNCPKFHPTSIVKHPSQRKIYISSSVSIYSIEYSGKVGIDDIISLKPMDLCTKKKNTTTGPDEIKGLESKTINPRQAKMGIDSLIIITIIGLIGMGVYYLLRVNNPEPPPPGAIKRRVSVIEAVKERFGVSAIYTMEEEEMDRLAYNNLIKSYRSISPILEQRRNISKESARMKKKEEKEIPISRQNSSKSQILFDDLNKQPNLDDLYKGEQEKNMKRNEDSPEDDLKIKAVAEKVNPPTNIFHKADSSIRNIKDLAVVKEEPKLRATNAESSIPSGGNQPAGKKKMVAASEPDTKKINVATTQPAFLRKPKPKPKIVKRP